MSDDARLYIRQSDYYGGSLWVEPFEEWDDRVEVSWVAYQGGGASLELSPVEARALAVALAKVAGPPEEWDPDFIAQAQPAPPTPVDEFAPAVVEEGT
jgi:hypothetical protein